MNKFQNLHYFSVDKQQIFLIKQKGNEYSKKSIFSFKNCFMFYLKSHFYKSI